jgi:hypothetical protein
MAVSGGGAELQKCLSMLPDSLSSNPRPGAGHSWATSGTLYVAVVVPFRFQSSRSRKIHTGVLDPAVPVGLRRCPTKTPQQLQANHWPLPRGLGVSLTFCD